MRSRSRRERGFTMIELAVSSAAGMVLLIGAGMLVKSTSDSSHSAFRRTMLADQTATALEALGQDLRIAGYSGEDENGNGVLDGSEDTNRNGRLDADFNVADGASASTLVMNLVDDDGFWTSPVTWAVTDGALTRTDAAGTRTICNHVRSFVVVRSGFEITATLTVGDRDSTGRRWSETARRRIHVRN